MSLRFIVALIAAAGLAAVGIAGAVIVGRAQDRMTADAERTMTGYAQLVALAHTRWIEESLPLLASLSALDADDFRTGVCMSRLAAMRERMQGYDTLLIANAKGDVVCAPHPLPNPVSVADRAYFKRAVATGRFTTGEYLVGRVSGLRVLPVALPILDADGRVDRVLIAGKQLEQFRLLVEGLKLPAGLHVGLLDRHGVELSTYHEHELPIADRVALAPALAEAVAGDRPFFREIDGTDGVARMVAFVPLGGPDVLHGIVVSRQSREVLAEEVSFLWNAVAVMTATMVAAVAAILLLLQRFVVAPIRRLVLGTRAIQAGDRSWRAAGASGGSTELHQLCLSLDAMLGALASQERRIKDQAVELERSNTDLQNFAYTVSHDLREPLRSISSFVRLIERRYGDQLDAEGHEFMAFVTDGAERMSRMLDGVLEYSRINSRGGEQEVVALDGPLDQALRSLTLAIEESGARIDRMPLPTVLGDGEQLARLFQNLVANAIKFAKPGQPPRVSITVRPLDGMWEIAVADNGIGLPAEGRQALFQLFRRLVPREQVAGDGVGLALCKRIVERHGGTIRVESVEGEGATFLFTLKAA